ncbi:MAG TPA: alkene reductase [Sphingomonas sp.]|nr:alkene reductase [Sphingomonas sp.]
MPSLFDTLQLGAVAAPNRILMAPLTRARATRDHVPTPVMVDYYRQRAGAGLILSEATGISPQGLGWPYAPGLWSDEQVEAWKPVTAAVHAAGGHILAQLWHMGRVVHSSITGEQPVSASATQADGNAHTYDGKQPYEAARALGLDEIPALLDDYRRAARNARRAGFDGVQLHAANGYLIDQFLRDATNRRDDRYGGSIENRIRLLTEVTQALIDEVGAVRVAVRLSPNDGVNGTEDSDPESLFVAAAAALDRLGIAFLEMRASRPDSSFVEGERDLVPAIRAVFARPLVLNSDYGLDDGQAALDEGRADAIAYGRPYIANPDLVTRLRARAPLAEPQPATFYTQGPEGYVDYPALEAVG